MDMLTKFHGRGKLIRELNSNFVNLILSVMGRRKLMILTSELVLMCIQVIGKCFGY